MQVSALGFADRRKAILDYYRLLPEVYKSRYSSIALLHVVAADSFELATSKEHVHLPDDEIHDLVPLDRAEMANQSLSTALYFTCLAAHEILSEYVKLFLGSLFRVSRETRAEDLQEWSQLSNRFGAQLERCVNNGMIFHQDIDMLARNELQNVLATIDTIETKHRRLLQMLPAKVNTLVNGRSLLDVILFLAGAFLTFLYIRGIKS